MQIEQILSKCKGIKKQPDTSFMVKCPAHPDKSPSLHITQADDRVLLDCFSGCTTESIVDALGITLADLFTDAPKQENKKIVAEYNYHDEEGKLLYQVVRYEPKSFAQRHRNGRGEWVWEMKGIRRVLYHLPEILKEDGTIYLVEGEKDADKLWEYGQVATTSPGGASNWNPEYGQYLKDKRVVIIPDKDVAGFKYAQAVLKSIQGKAKEVKCIILPDDEVKDFSDWLEKYAIEDLPSLEQSVDALSGSDKLKYEVEEDAITWAKNVNGQPLKFKAESIRQAQTGIHARISILLDYTILAWTLCNIERAEERTRLSNAAATASKDLNKEDLRHDLDIFCSGLWDFKLSTFIPEVMSGDDTAEAPVFYLYPYIVEEGGSILFAPPGRGKSNTAMLWAQSINCGVSKLWKVTQAPVLYINLERSAQSLRRRLASINTILELPVSQSLLTLNARGHSLIDLAPVIRKSVQQRGIKLIILDSLSRAGYGDLNENKSVNSIIDTLSSLCPSWLALGHTSRASEDHLFGSIMADAGADIIIQLRSQITESKLGIGYEITKSNDLPQISQRVWAFEFKEWRMTNVRPATAFEFPDIEGKTKTNMLDSMIDFVLNQDTADASATEVETALGYNRVNVSKIFNQSGKFVKTRKDKHSQYFGVKDG